jgi:hypothetical protein
MGSAYENLVGKYQGKIQLGTLTPRWKAHIKLDLTEIWGGSNSSGKWYDPTEGLF